MSRSKGMYDNKQKRRFRRWAWGQISNRIEKGSTVMVLCGDTAGDLPFAALSGMKVVGVDVCKDCCLEFRRRGGVAIQDRLHRAICAFRPDGIIADMLGGITTKSFDDIFITSIGCKAVVWNGLRGRDRAAKIRFSLGGRLSKHRGRVAWSMLCGTVIKAWRDGGICGNDNIVISRQQDEALHQVYRPSFYSYKSADSGQYFDSIAYSNPQSQHGCFPRLDARRHLDSLHKAAMAELELHEGDAI